MEGEEEEETDRRGECRQEARSMMAKSLGNAIMP